MKNKFFLILYISSRLSHSCQSPPQINLVILTLVLDIGYALIRFYLCHCKKILERITLEREMFNWGATLQNVQTIFTLF